MCGIVGYTGSRECRALLLDSLKRLEYRGYDSAGLALQNGSINIIKTEGKVDDLKARTPLDFKGKTGIAHTRWATHGEPSERNSHPHLSASGDLVMVHNGIIENSEELKKVFPEINDKLVSDTDSEVLLNVIDRFYQLNGHSMLDALLDSFRVCEGSYALVLLSARSPGELVVCKKGSPVVIGESEDGVYVASDIYAISEHTSRFYFPEDGDIVFLDEKGLKAAYHHDGSERKLEEKHFEIETEDNELLAYSHFMEKEIYEQPAICERLISEGLDIKSANMSRSEYDEMFRNVERITILGCGTSWHAGLVARHLIEKYARIHVNCEYASEYRYRDPVINKGDLVISISQSGETADTIAANRLARESGAISMGIINVMNCTLERESDLQVFLRAGTEIGVASTKAYTSQLVVLSLLTEYICRLRSYEIPADEIRRSFTILPDIMKFMLEDTSELERIAAKFTWSNNFLFLGRGLNYPTALEGALKLKEISYIHAEGYPGAEMKHGPIALIDYKFPTLAVVSDQENRVKMVSNIKEIKARGGTVVAMCAEGDEITPAMVDEAIMLPALPDILTPVVSAVYLQLFAYYISVNRGCNVDKPRNLAKSVTVE
ncbi:MAG: glutamine--fructose-6-phosphate transaminase (isomerizing) [Marinilabiliaceae bacterium]|jgi:glucosamine--fructose-6-phosphate aminotransferase (isomerizing)|nr:glutamine--fructose-6-phosphate transaminase (isomerizing) [Marinilabiliaceae bacterium]